MGQGVLEGVDAIFGVHMANQATGTISACKGVTSTVAGGFFATIKGQSSHAPMPQNCADPVLVAAQITVALNTIVSRSVAPDHMNVVNVGMIWAGGAPDVIPDTARIGVSMRTVADEDWEVLGSRATDIVEETCAAYGATATFEWADGYPVIVNDDDVAQIGYDAAV
ncbi:peptidase dimerization domain-containing protein [Kocuria marina]|uniref:peptidase dimerization domain-containing protein n=1 Tax=Kocuria marina TaxID=223184 RepID=UPI0021B25E4E|nr:peptidase dimerization domain-containing protein [Kocuria indica]